MKSDNDLLEALEANAWGLRPVETPTGGGDAEVAWEVVGYFQAKPTERALGYGMTPRQAIVAALTTWRRTDDRETAPPKPPKPPAVTYGQADGHLVRNDGRYLLQLFEPVLGPCPKCKGVGTSAKYTCRRCHGTRTIRQAVSL